MICGAQKVSFLVSVYIWYGPEYDNASYIEYVLSGPEYYQECRPSLARSFK